MIVVIDYGMGNLRSVEKALQSVQAQVLVSGDPAVVARASKVVLPGVGAFPAAMQELQARRLVEPITAAVARGVPYLGICLGLQLLFDTSEEGNGAKGLGILPGTVVRFPEAGGPAGGRLKVPHMGWNEVRRGRGECPLLQGIPDQSFFYFVHSYYVVPADDALATLEAEYGTRFTAMVWRGSLFATQFHPEKSQSVGLTLLRNFVNL